MQSPEHYDVIIVGGGPAGLTCALTLASGLGRDNWNSHKRLLVIDQGRSDLKKALLNNVPAVAANTGGPQLLQTLQAQLLAFPAASWLDDTVLKIGGQINAFRVNTHAGKSLSASLLVLATGFQEYKIEGLGLQAADHRFSPRPGKIMLPASNHQVAEGVYVAGLVAGVPTMFAAAAGSGCEVACQIYSLWAGKNAVIHDNLPV